MERGGAPPMSSPVHLTHFRQPQFSSRMAETRSESALEAVRRSAGAWEVGILVTMSRILLGRLRSPSRLIPMDDCGMRPAAAGSP